MPPTHRSAWTPSALEGAFLLLVGLSACQRASRGDACAQATGVSDPALTIEQVDLGGTIGEAALVTGPGGVRVWIDVGNDRHEGTIAGRASEVDLVILTHDDADHVDGADAVRTTETWTWETTGLPRTLELGDGAVLVLFKADGRPAGQPGRADLHRPRQRHHRGH